MYFGYRSLSYISLSEATSIGFTKVFFTSILAFFFLKEKLNLFSLIFFFTGFFGVYLQDNFAQWISMLLFLIYSAGYFIIAYTYKIKNVQ